MNLESFSAATVTLRVSKAKNAPNNSSNPEPQKITTDQTCSRIDMQTHSLTDNLPL